MTTLFLSHELPLPELTGLVHVPWVVPFHGGPLVPRLFSDEDGDGTPLLEDGGGAALLNRVGVDGGLLLLAPGLLSVGD